MRQLIAVLALCVCAMVVGCAPSKPPEETLPKVTLVKREPMDEMMMMRFIFTDMDRVNWKNCVLKAAIVKSGDAPPPGAQEFKDPGKEFGIEVVLGKTPGDETILFVPVWGPAAEGFISKDEPLDLVVKDGKTNSVELVGYAEHHINQVLQMCSGPGRAIPFDPVKGVDLLTVGYKPDAWSLHVWAEKPSAK